MNTKTYTILEAFEDLTKLDESASLKITSDIIVPNTNFVLKDDLDSYDTIECFGNKDNTISAYGSLNIYYKNKLLPVYTVFDIAAEIGSVEYSNEGDTSVPYGSTWVKYTEDEDFISDIKLDNVKIININFNIGKSNDPELNKLANDLWSQYGEEAIKNPSCSEKYKVKLFGVSEAVRLDDIINSISEALKKQLPEIIKPLLVQEIINHPDKYLADRDNDFLNY